MPGIRPESGSGVGVPREWSSELSAAADGRGVGDADSVAPRPRWHAQGQTRSPPTRRADR